MLLQKIPKTNNFFIIFLLVVSFFVAFSGPIWDIDFWWHIATGKYIIENKNLPDTDPFSYTSEQSISPDRNIILKGYWLAQVIFYLVFKVAGLYGIIFLRASILVAILLLLYVWAKKTQCNIPVILFFIVLAGLLSSHYPSAERPQLFSFFFAPLTVFLLESFKKNTIAQKNNLRIFILLPLVMLMWANCHHGFALGTLILIIYWATETARIALEVNQLSRSNFIKLTLLVCISVIMTFINPSAYGAYLGILKFQGSIVQQMTSEYLSPFTISKHGAIIWLWPYWTYLLITLSAFIWSFKKMDYAYGAITLFLAVISLTAVRYVPFFIYTTIPFTALHVTAAISDRPKLERATKTILLPALILAMIFIGITGYKSKFGNSLSNPIEKYRFPEKAAAFIKQYSPHGKIFNHFEWGGYLIWELYPEYKVFMDGRNLNLVAFRDSIYMIWDTPEAQLLFDRYGIDIIIMPGIDPFTGEMYTVVNQLVRDNQWHLIYWDEISLIFIRGSENDALIKKLSLPKTGVYDQIIKQGTLLLNSGMKSPYLEEAMEMANNAKKMYKER